MTDESRLVGWYVEIPRTLRDKFDAIYPGRRNKKILTITAIQHAIDKAPKSLYNLYKNPTEVKDGVESASIPDEGSGTEPTAGEGERSISGEHSVSPDPDGD